MERNLRNWFREWWDPQDKWVKIGIVIGCIAFLLTIIMVPFTDLEQT